MADNVAVDVIPEIVVTATMPILNSTLKKINTILQKGEVTKKIDCVKNIKVSMSQYSDNPKAYQKYEKALVESKVFETMVDLITKEDLEYLLDHDQNCRLIIDILECMVDTTDYLGDVGKSIAKAGGILYLTNICRCEDFINKTDNKNVHSLLLWSIATLRNLARLASVPQYFKENRTADAMVQFFGKDEQLQVYAILMAAQILDKSEVDILIDDKNIKSILKYLNEARKDKSHRYGGTKIPDLLDVIDKLAVADPIKILKGEALPTFLEVLKLDNLEEQAITSGILWTMSYDGYIANKIKLNTELMEKLKSLLESGDQTVNIKVHGCLETLNKVTMLSKDATSVATHSTPKLSSTADVKKWLTNNKLSNCCQYVKDVNGEGLLQFKHMSHAAPEFYYKILSEKLKLNLDEMLNLTAALAKI